MRWYLVQVRTGSGASAELQSKKVHSVDLLQRNVDLRRKILHFGTHHRVLIHCKNYGMIESGYIAASITQEGGHILGAYKNTEIVRLGGVRFEGRQQSCR